MLDKANGQHHKSVRPREKAGLRRALVRVCPAIVPFPVVPGPCVAGIGILGQPLAVCLASNIEVCVHGSELWLMASFAAFTPIEDPFLVGHSRYLVQPGQKLDRLAPDRPLDRALKLFP